MELTEIVDIESSASRGRLDREAGVLLGSLCPSCGATSWPPRAVCHVCGSGLTLDHPLPRQGRMLSFTTVHVSRPGLEAPYTLGQIEIGDALFFGHVRELPDDATVPMPVQVVIPAEGDGPLSFWFEPS